MELIGQGKGAAEWPGVRVHGLIQAVVARQIHLFASFPEFGERDLFSEARLAVEKAWPRFDPAKASESTYISIVAHRRLISLWRTCTRRAGREAKVARTARAAAPPAAGDADRRAVDALAEWADARDEATRADGLLGGLGDDRTIDEWAGAVYRQAMRTFPAGRGARTGRPGYTVPQLVTCVLVMRKLSLTTRGAEQLFADSPELCKALRLDRVPDHSWFGRAASFATENFRLFRRARPRRGGE